MTEEKGGAGISLATKSMWKTPEKFFPIVVDDFFSSPEVIMEYGKSLPKEIISDRPGVRTKQLWELDVELHNTILKKVLSCYYDLDYVNLSWKLSDMSFHEIIGRNKGIIHQDNDVYYKDDGPDNEVAGLIYLTPDIDPDSGTSLWNLKFNAIVKPKGEAEETEHRENFTEKLRFQNIFNRLIMYDASQWHGANSYYHQSGKDPRLTLTFFIGGLEGTKFPLERIKSREVKL